MLPFVGAASPAIERSDIEPVAGLVRPGVIASRDDRHGLRHRLPRGPRTPVLRGGIVPSLRTAR